MCPQFFFSFFLPIIGLQGKVLVAFRGVKAASVASLTNCQKLSPCLTQSAAADSKRDPSLAKAKPIGDGGIIFKKGQKKSVQQLGVTYVGE